MRLKPGVPKWKADLILRAAQEAAILSEQGRREHALLMKEGAGKHEYCHKHPKWPADRCPFCRPADPEQPC
jgi:hypothetical protein